MSGRLRASTPVIGSIALHAGGLLVAATLATPYAPSSAARAVPIELVMREAAPVALSASVPPPKRQAVPPPPPTAKPRRTEALTLPRLVARPEQSETPMSLPPAAAPVESSPPEPRPAPEPPSAAAPAPSAEAPPGNALTGRTEGAAMTPVEGGALRAESFSSGDIGVAQGSGLYASGSGADVAGVPRAGGDGLTSFARPRGGYQTRPAYPETARRAGVEGVSVLRFQVLADGKVGGVTVERSAGHEDLDRVAIAAVRTWRFDPARRGAEAVAVWVTLPVRFELRGR